MMLSEEKLKTLVSEFKNPGYYTAVWDGLNDAGIKVNSGIYLYTLTSDKVFESRKMILLK